LHGDFCDLGYLFRLNDQRASINRGSSHHGVIVTLPRLGKIYCANVIYHYEINPLLSSFDVLALLE